MPRRKFWRFVSALVLFLVASATVGQKGNVARGHRNIGATVAPVHWLLPDTLRTTRREPRATRPFWEDRWLVATRVTLLAVGTSLIGGLFAQRSRRRQAESAARATEADLRRSHERISDLAGRLITAQEAERARIARELHDGVCQDMAAISVDISHLRQHAGELQLEAIQESLSGLQQRTARIAESLRLLSHGLHPSVLHHIGLMAALQAQCAEVERQHGIQVRFFADGEVEPAGQLVGVSLFRIAQEALRNTARHARARNATLSLARVDAELMLAICDDGIGFDVVAARQNGGLGLVSIEERARLVHGRVTIDSKPGRGTIVDVRIPVGVVDAASGAALAEQPGVNRKLAGRATAAAE